MSFVLEDQRYITAARGWLELGDHISAFDELERLPPQKRAHPEVLKIRWEIYNRAGKHGNAFVVADGLTRLLPSEPEPFLWRSYSARRMKGGTVQQAMELLLDVVNDFEDEPTFPFNLTCYNCQLGNMEHALSWLHVAFEVAERNGTTKHWKTCALDEPDLASLRKDFGGL